MTAVAPGAAAVEHRAAHLRHFSVRDFRNLAHVELALPEAGGVFVGRNGHGKTNLLEAVYYLHLFRSMRGAHDAELPRFGSAGFHLAAGTAGAPFDHVSVGYERASGRKRIVLDGVPTARLSEAFGALPSVVFAPADVGLVAGAPAMRRRFLDVALATTSRRYLTALQQYRIALAQRNAALRSSEAVTVAPVWEGALAHHGGVLLEERRAWVTWAQPRLEAAGQAIGERASLLLRYRTAIDGDVGGDAASLEVALAEALARQRGRDVERGLTHTGPHRDDLDVRLGGHAARRFGSAGQQRSAAIALRLLERTWYRERSGREPLVLLDDPLAELDPERGARVLALLETGVSGQCLLAVPRPDDVPAGWTGFARFRVEDGAVMPEAA